MTEARQTYSIEQIKDMLLARADQVVACYTQSAPDDYTDKGKHFTRNPGRVDRSVGSFVIYLQSGRWKDFSTNDGGDLIDLIKLSLGCNAAEALAEARAFLGLQNETPEQRQARAKADALAAQRRKQVEAANAVRTESDRARAEALFLSGQNIAGTPVEHYLKARGIDLRALGHAPGSLRFHPDCYFHHDESDPQTGEFFEVKLRMPAMLAAMVDGSGKIKACHRTWLQMGPDRRWDKARIPSPRDPSRVLKSKKVLATCGGASIRLSSGIGPRGGKAARLHECPPGTTVYISEGIENALSALVLKPGIRVLAAYSLSNLGSLDLPANVAEVVLITDNDMKPPAQEALRRVIQMHVKAGRRVRTWTSDLPGEDLNDALQRALRAEAEEQGAA